LSKTTVHFSSSDVEDQLHVVVDRNLVTGQNIHSTGGVVHMFVWLLKGGEKALKSSPGLSEVGKDV